MDAELHRRARAAKGFMPDEEGLALYRAGRRAVASGLGPLLEIGTYCAKSAIYLGAAVAAPAPGAAARPGGSTVVFTVDHHRGSEENQAGWPDHDPSLIDPRSGRMDTLGLARRNLEEAGLERDVVVVVGPSTTVALHWTTPLALLFIDGGHGEDVAWADYRAWTPKLAAGGLLAIHDVFPDPSDGGRPPYQLYCEALRSGAFEEVDGAGCGSLRVLRRSLL